MAARKPTEPHRADARQMDQKTETAQENDAVVEKIPVVEWGCVWIRKKPSPGAANLKVSFQARRRPKLIRIVRGVQPMLVREIMSSQIECVHSEATIQQAAEKMKQVDVGSIPIVDNEQLVGMITDRDIAIRSVAGGSNPQMSRVRDVMTPEVISCYEDQEVGQALLSMQSHQVRRLPVLNRDNKLVGIISLGDLAVDVPDSNLVGQALEGISLPSQQA